MAYNNSMSNLDFYKDKFVPDEKVQIEPVEAHLVAISDEEPEFVCPKCGRSGVDKPAPPVLPAESIQLSYP